MTEWNNWDAPENDALVYVLAEDQRGQYEVPFPVVFRDDRWRNAHTGEELDIYVAAWRPSE